MEIRQKLTEARREYALLIEQFNNADVDYIDNITYKLKAKEQEMEALSNELSKEISVKPISKTPEIEKRHKSIWAIKRWIRDRLRLRKSRVSNS